MLHTIREARSALVAATSPELRETPQGDSLDRFLAKLPSLWRQGETRPTHAARVRSPPPESAPDPDRGCGTAARPPRTGCPVHNRHQVEESPGRVQVDDVGRPHPVGPADFGVLQQIGEDPMIRRRRAGAGPTVDGPHQPGINRTTDRARISGKPDIPSRIFQARTAGDQPESYAHDWRFRRRKPRLGGGKAQLSNFQSRRQACSEGNTTQQAGRDLLQPW